MTEEPTPAPALPWSDSFSVGIEALDNEHRALVRLVNAVCAAWHEGQKEAALDAFDSLTVLADDHFRHEEEILRGIPGYQDLASYVSEHQNRLKQLTALRGRFENAPAGSKEAGPCNHLIDWFVRQIIGHDAAIKSLRDDYRPQGFSSGSRKAS